MSGVKVVSLHEEKNAIAKRSSMAFEQTDETRVYWQRRFEQNHLRPTSIEVQRAKHEVAEFLCAGNVHIIIPMKEIGPVVQPVLQVMVNQINPAHILVVNDGSDDAATATVQSFSTVRMVMKDAILDCLDWGKLSPLLNLRERPRGKGICVLAGHLAQYVLAEQEGKRPPWLAQCDSEIKEFASYQCLEHLVWGMLNSQATHSIKMSMPGRDNERTMTARSMLWVLAQRKELPNGIAGRARDLFERLCQHKWMLTGEWMTHFEVAMDRLFMSGYTDETLNAIFLEDWGYKNGHNVVHVENPNPRLDGKNTLQKDSIMLQVISNFILLMAFVSKPLERWGIDEVAAFNVEALPETVAMAWIPDSNDPVRAEAITNERMLPSVNMLVKNGLVDIDRLKKIIVV